MSEQKHLWECKHDYYCTEGQYFSNQSERQTIWEYKSLAEFLAEMGEADNDYNMLFRWDWTEENDDLESSFNGDVNYRNGQLKLFYMIQRKGYHMTAIVSVCRADEDAVKAFLDPKLAHLMGLWEPLQLTQPGEAIKGER